MSTYAKYMDRYKRLRSASSDGRPDLSFKGGSIIDRETYTKFMELELEKVGAAFMQVKHLPERMEQLQNQIIINQEKISNLSRIVNSIQDTENSQENDLRDIKGALRKLGVNSNASKDREYTKFKVQNSKSEENNELILRIHKLEERISYPNENKDDQNSNRSVVTKVDASLRDLEEKLVKMITERLPETGKHQRSRSRGKSPTPGTDFKNIEKSVNKWTEKIEEQVNIINNTVEDRVTLVEFKNKMDKEKRDRFEDLDKVHKLAENAEKVASRLAEDVYSSVSMSNKKIDDFEDRLNQLREWVEDLSRVGSLKGLKADNSNASVNPALVTKSDLMNFEKKLNHKILESLDETNDIMKKLKRQYKDLSNRVNKIEDDKVKTLKNKSKKSSSKTKISENNSQEKFANNPHYTLNTDISDKSLKKMYNSSDRIKQNSLTNIEPYKHKVDVVRTFAVPKYTHSNTFEKVNIDTSKDTQDYEFNEKTIKRFPEPKGSTSKEFTEYMTFDDNNSSGLFDLSDNETSKLKDKSVSKSRQMKRSSSRQSNKSMTKDKSQSNENSHPNQSKPKRSRIEEFESLRKKGKSRKLKSTSRSQSTKKSKRGSNKKDLSKYKFKDTRIRKVEPTKNKTKSKAVMDKNSSIKLAKLDKIYYDS